jgi:hypothetical protein
LRIVEEWMEECHRLQKDKCVKKGVGCDYCKIVDYTYNFERERLKQ